MLDSIDINLRDKPAAATATSWFDAISTNFHAAAAKERGYDPFSFISSQRPDVTELTPSTIRYNEDSTTSPRNVFSATQSPIEPAREDLQAQLTDVTPSKPTSHEDTLAINSTPNAATLQRSRHVDLYDDAMRAKLAKRQWAAVEQMRQMILEKVKVERECPFKPKLSPYAVKIQRPAELAPQNRVYDELMRKEEWRARKRQEHIRRELEGCTFRPLTLRAAKLKSSAHTHDSHVFSELYSHDEERNHFVREVQPYVVEQLERHMLFKNPSNKPLPEDKINAVVERLFSCSVVVNPEEGTRRRSQSPSPPFKPTVSVNSARIVAKQREGGNVKENVVERLLQPTAHLKPSEQLRQQTASKQGEEELELMRSEYVRRLQGLLQRERRRSIIAAKFELLSGAINKERQSREGSQRCVTEHSAQELVRAGAVMLSSAEAQELCSILAASGAGRLNKNGFIALCTAAVEGLPNPGVSPLGRAPPPRAPTMGGGLTDADRGVQDGARRTTFRREIPSPEELEKMRARREERTQQMTEEEYQKRQAMMEEEQRQCTFRPPPPRRIPKECHVNHTVDVKTTKAAALRRAYIEKRLEGEEHAGGTAAALPLASTKDLFGAAAGAGGAHTRAKLPQSVAAHSLLASSNPRTKPSFAGPIVEASPAAKAPYKRCRGGKAHRSYTGHGEGFSTRKDHSSRSVPAVASDRSSDDAAAAYPRPRKMRTRESVAVAEAPSPRVYRDVVSEHAAFGRDGALSEFGRELILRQLREYRDRR
ncbi:hypothetical protein TraAM80_03705 [Trypanosoma rangeli]|uniref:Uncharacterized protein n=1 Tax=Trypanosoma rangeli TaxID=5698 RepID=A0A3R7NHW7_TRYRA|nr:uncharacterized protein TraAM80_03705 [Trypanosoma rangeli]RNF06784.1 hypothetical protein TraAM80_03705 [Trypanosoma rangeli]|eukprot:RNF06784.1 hypothetical protein TraAM80_03705 [Trypanosoma rangeli]